MIKSTVASDLTGLSPEGKIPKNEPYEVKLLVCGLSRAFFGKTNTIDVPVRIEYPSETNRSAADGSNEPSSRPDREAS